MKTTVRKYRVEIVKTNKKISVIGKSLTEEKANKLASNAELRRKADTNYVRTVLQ